MRDSNERFSSHVLPGVGFGGITQIGKQRTRDFGEQIMRSGSTQFRLGRDFGEVVK